MKTQSILIRPFIQRSFKVVGSLSAGVLLIIFLAAGLTNSRAQDTWHKKADFAGGVRQSAVGFSIGAKGYIGTGYDGISNKNDFWEYDPATNVWTQKADFGGGARGGAVGFSIGNKGYIGTGRDPNFNFKNDFWEYDPLTNAWTQKANFGGEERAGAVGFSIGNKGYIGTGSYAVYPFFKNDFWEYDPSTDAWAQKADFGGTIRYHAVGFSIGSKGYIGTGGDNVNPYYKNDFWEYDPTTNGWTQKANFAGIARMAAVGFSIGSMGYVGVGESGNWNSDFWEYDPATDSWMQKADVGGTGRTNAAGFSIGSKGYIGTGWGDSNEKNDFWEYTPGTAQLCIVPEGLTTLKITGTSAKLKWEAVAGAEGYTVRYKVSNTSVWKTGTTDHNAKVLNQLLPNTEYIWQVRTFCDLIAPYVMSDWSSKQFFTTGSARVGDEDAVTLGIFPNPVSENFTLDLQLNSIEDQSVDIFLLNALGQIVYSEKVIASNGELSEGLLTEKKEISMSSTASSGLYILKVVMNDQVIEKKLLYQK